MSFRIVKQAKPHACELPGWWQRRRLGLGVGSVIECTECLQTWVRETDGLSAYWAKKWKFRFNGDVPNG